MLATNAEKLMLYPHVLLSCLVLLPLPSTELFTHALPLLLTVPPPDTRKLSPYKLCVYT